LKKYDIIASGQMITTWDGEFLMKKYYADKTSLNFLRVFAFFALSGIIIGLRYLLNYLEETFPQYFIVSTKSIPEIVIWGLIIFVAGVYVIYILIFLPMWYNSLSYSVSAEEIIVRAGVINKNIHFMKMSAVQYVTVIQMPFSAVTSFNFLVVSAHGGRLVFMFLSPKDAVETAEKIRKYAKQVVA